MRASYISISEAVYPFQNYICKLMQRPVIMAGTNRFGLPHIEGFF